MAGDPPGVRRVDDEAQGPWPRRLLLLGGAALVLTALAALGLALAERYWRAAADATLAALSREGLGADVAELRPVPDGPNGAEELASAFGAFEELPEEILAVFGLTAADLRAGLEAVLDRALAQSCVFPSDWSGGPPAELAHLVELKTLTGALTLRATWRVHRGDRDGAWRDLERALALAAAADEPLLVGRLVRHALVHVTLGAMVEALRAGAPPPDLGARLELAFEALEQPEGLTRALRGELGLVHDRDALLELAGRPPRWLPRSTWEARYRYQFVTVMSNVIRGLRGVPPPLGLDLLASQPARDLHLSYLEKVYAKEVSTLALVRATRAALRLAAASPPGAPSFRLPADPWDRRGAPLRYARTGPRSAKVWSVGEDQQDDGGRAPDRGVNEGPGAPGTDVVVDLVWPED